MVFLSSVVPIVLGTLMVIYWAQRKVYAGFAYWVAANFLIGGGFLLLVMRGIIPDFFSVMLGNLLTILAAVLIYEGLQAFFNRPLHDKLNYTILILFLILLWHYTYATSDVDARIMLASLTSFIINIRIGLNLIVDPIPRLKRASLIASLNSFFLASLSVVRGIYTIVQAGQTDLFTDQIHAWSSLGLIVAMIVWVFYFFFLNSARVELDLEDARRELVRIAGTDSLTGISNHRHFFEHAEVEFQRARRNMSGLAIILMDADHFKRINDQYGHDMGDITLQYIARKLQSEVRPFDLVARFGGDEFVVMLPGVNKSQSGLVAERLQAAIRGEAVVSGPVSIRVNMSMGVSLLREGDADIRPILKRADAAMYRAKKLLRKHIVVD